MVPDCARGGNARRLLIVEGSTIRLPHLRFARVVLELILSAETRDPLLEAVRAAIDGERYELWGIHWLLDELLFSDPTIAPKRSQLTVKVAERLVARCWAAAISDRGAAAFVLNDVRRLQPETVDLHLNAGLLGTWISEAEPKTMPGIARLLNDTYNKDEELLGTIVSCVDTAALARRFQECDWPEPYFFGDLFGRLGLGPKPFRERMAQALDRARVVAVFRAWPDADDAELSDLAEALTGFASLDYDLTLDLLGELAPAIAERWQAGFAAGYGDLIHVAFLLGFGPSFLRHRKPEQRQRRIARNLCEALDPATVADAVSHATQREWQGVGEGLLLISEATPRHAKRITRLIDFQLLDASTAEFWERRVEALRYLLVGLAHGRGYQPAATWVAQHVPGMLRIEPLTATLAPAASAKRLRELDAILELSQPSHHWEITGMALRGIAQTDPELARRSVASHRAAFTAAFGEASQLDSADPVITTLEQLDSGELRAAVAAVAAVDPAKASERWAQILRGKSLAARRAAAHLIAVALETDGRMRDVARDLRKRFPAAARRP